MHWASNYIGIKWVLGGRDLKVGFDCYGFFKYIQKQHYSIDVSDVSVSKYRNIPHKQIIKNFKKGEELKNWYEVVTAKDGDMVLLRKSKYINHIGVWINPDISTIGILHCLEKSGVIFTSQSSLKISGWKISRFYRHISK